MTTFDFSPLYRTSIGFDRLASLMSSASRQDQSNSYPPYNIRTTGEDNYQITMAVAGFSESDITITTENNRLSVTGNRSEDDEQAEYLYRGIATRAFERHFNLADHVKVVGATMQNGLLHIDLEREIPEAMKPRQIKIDQPSKRLEGAEKGGKKAAKSHSTDKAA